MLIFNPTANELVHFEFEAGHDGSPKEVEVYLGGYFLCCVDIKDISDQAKEQLFDNI
jgi:hypothetical protein